MFHNCSAEESKFCRGYCLIVAMISPDIPYRSLFCKEIGQHVSKKVRAIRIFEGLPVRGKRSDHMDLRVIIWMQYALICVGSNECNKTLDFIWNTVTKSHEGLLVEVISCRRLVLLIDEDWHLPDV